MIDTAVAICKEDGHRYIFRYNAGEVLEFITSSDPLGCRGLSIVQALNVLVEDGLVSFDEGDAAKVFYMMVQASVSQKTSGGPNDTS